MNKITPCPNRKDIVMLFTASRTIAEGLGNNIIVPPAIVSHARTCADCEFWLSYTLAGLFASNLTYRATEAKLCLLQSDFQKLLIAAVRVTQTVDIETPPQNVNLLKRISQYQYQKFPAIREHLETCAECCGHYETLYGITREQQAQLIEAIEQGFIIPVPELISV